MEKYNVNQISISGLLGNIENGDIAIPEIQRPFVWKKTQVRDLLDSLYKGYPTGYLIIWKNPNVKLKDGSYSSGKKILIDGQQRVTALMTAIGGQEIIDSSYTSARIKIAFNPYNALKEEAEDELKIFEVQSGAILKDKRWIPDIAEIFNPNFDLFSFVDNYLENNPEMTRKDIQKAINKLLNIKTRQIGTIDLADTLSIDVVTEMFIRINSKGTTLSQGDFVMSKIAADEEHKGNDLRKLIDYFAHFASEPHHFDEVCKKDVTFASDQDMEKIKWLKNDSESIFNPTCDDVLRVSFMTMYPRAKLADLVNLLSGRDFEEKVYKKEITDDTYIKLREGVLKFVNEDNFKNFMLALRSAGFISSKLVNSKMAIDFAYVLYLRLKETKEVDISEIKRLVQKWYVLSVLTGRYSSSPETVFYTDIKKINEQGVKATLEEIENAKLSDNFWENQISLDLDSVSPINPAYQVYVAAQIFFNEKSLLSASSTVRDLIDVIGDTHHIFPKAYLKKKGFEKQMYNQNANFAFLDTQVNKSISDKAPNIYFKEAFEQCETKNIVCGSIIDKDNLVMNLNENCIPKEIVNYTHENYETFLKERRKLMGRKIKKYYESL